MSLAQRQLRAGHKEFGECDKIVINGNEEEVGALSERMEEEEEGQIEGEEVEESAEKALAKTEVDGKLGNAGIGEQQKDGAKASSKRFKATGVIPANATKEGYASIFISSRKSDFKETCSCRSLPLGRN
ncbi:hypothetical protein QQ045_012895 [Rhodiola kirilowii]